MPRRWWAGVGVGLLVLACGANNVRPRSGPAMDAVLDTIAAKPTDVIDSLAALVAIHGFELARFSAAEGYLETKWFDLGAGRSGGTYTRHPDRVIRIRLYADPTGDQRTLLRSEAVFRRALDPSVPTQVLETMVPIGHPGDSLLQVVLDGIRPRTPIRGS